MAGIVDEGEVADKGAMTVGVVDVADVAALRSHGFGGDAMVNVWRGEKRRWVSEVRRSLVRRPCPSGKTCGLSYYVIVMSEQRNKAMYSARCCMASPGSVVDIYSRGWSRSWAVRRWMISSPHPSQEQPARTQTPERARKEQPSSCVVIISELSGTATAEEHLLHHRKSIRYTIPGPAQESHGISPYARNTVNSFGYPFPSFRPSVASQADAAHNIHEDLSPEFHGIIAP